MGDKRKMNKEELREKRNRTIETLDDIKAVLGLDELYIDELEKACDETQKLLDKQIEATYKLDKENAELKHQLAHRNCLDCSNHSSKLRMRNLDLEKENAELKKQLEHRNCVDCSNHGSNIKLTKAKELLKEFVHHYKDKTIYIENMQDLLEQVVRFIKDSVVEI